MKDNIANRVREWLCHMGNSCIDPWPSITITEDTEEVSETNVVYLDPLKDKSNEDIITYKGKRDSQGRFDIWGTLTYADESTFTGEFKNGVKHGDAVIVSPNQGFSRVIGTYVQDKLQGKGKVVTNDTQVTDCFFQNGAIHGPMRRFAMKKFREFRQQLVFAGTYKHGRPSGMCWKYCEGGGFLVGTVDPLTGEFSGDQIAFLYPDYQTALLGRFENGVMKAAKPSTLIDVSLDQSTQILKPVFAKPQDNIPSVSYSKATKTYIGDNPLVSDPYEDSMVALGNSSVPDSGDGLFAKKDMPKGTIVAFYNGVRLPYKLGGPKEDWSTSGYKIYINADYESGERMDIPEEYISYNNYKASLGHKLNHSFRANCEEWFFEHPRFGLIPCERTKVDVKEGQELFLDYEYDPYNCPEWFSQQLIAFKKSMTDEEEAKLNVKYARFVV